MSMSNRTNVRNEKLMERARELALSGREDTVSSFKRRPSAFYTADHVLFYISAGVNIIIYLINFFATSLSLEINQTIDVKKVTQFRNMSVAAALLLAAAILVIVFKPWKDKCYLIAFITGTAAVIPMTVMFLLGKSATELYNSPVKYFLMYLAPEIVMYIPLIHIAFVIRGENKAIRKKYDDILQAIYEQNKAREEGIMSNEDWEKAIESYVDNPYGKEKLKKSLRRKSK